ncbi:hypothetical protein [Streptomyces griseorubiginosus]|uniref:hypothetical protein n=1 Tax=Streptomyces griseorubiginosus TaxID=67304 RepID=UPI0036E49E16
MIAEALDTLITLGWAFLIWLAALAAALGAALYTIALTLIALCRGLHRAARWIYRRTTRPAWAVDRATARRIARTCKEAA